MERDNKPEPTLDLDEYFEHANLLHKEYSGGHQCQTHFFKLGDVVGEGFKFWRFSGHEYKGKTKKKVRMADFICPECGERKRMSIAAVIHSGVKSCGCMKLKQGEGDA